MPISWKGTLQQYAGRLHRLCENKREVRIYDYIDIHVPMLEKMYHKRLAGYASIGYKARAANVPDDSMNIIFDSTTFLPVYKNDLLNAAREIMIVSPFVTKRRVTQMLPWTERLRPLSLQGRPPTSERGTVRHWRRPWRCWLPQASR